MRSKLLFALWLTSLVALGDCFSLSRFERNSLTTTMATLEPALQKQGKIAYSHVHLYVDKLEDLNTYKNYEDRLNEFFSLGKDLVDEGEKRALWQSISGFQVPDDPLFVTSNRDVVRQLLAGLGFRITAARYEATDGTRSVLVTSRDQSGVQILVTAAEPRAETNGDTKRSIYDRGKLKKTHS